MLTGWAIWQFSHPSRLTREIFYIVAVLGGGKGSFKVNMILHDEGLIRLFYIILMLVENVLYQDKNKPTGIIQWHKRDTAGLYFCFLFF